MELAEVAVSVRSAICSELFGSQDYDFDTMSNRRLFIHIFLFVTYGVYRYYRRNFRTCQPIQLEIRDYTTNYNKY